VVIENIKSVVNQTDLNLKTLLMTGIAKIVKEDIKITRVVEIAVY